MRNPQMKLRWKNLNLPFGPVYKKNTFEEKPSLSSRNLNRAGIMIEMKKGRKQYLIGNINENCGVCDDCVAFDKKSIVRRYAVVLDK